MKIQIKYIVLAVLFFTSQIGIAQQVMITYSAKEKRLSEVLEDISAQYPVKFAFDSDSFQKIKASFDIKESSPEQFLALLKNKYFIQSKLIEGTWVLIYNKPQTAIAPKTEQVPKSQMITVSGYVKDKTTGENLMYCNVIFGPNEGAMTNSLGFFCYEIPGADSVRILISHLGYKRLDTLVSTATTETLFLVPSEILMQEVEVKQVEKKILEAAPQPDKIGFNPIKSANIPRISSDDLANALLLIPGVNFIQGGSSGLSIRGSMPTDNLVLFDGIPVLETSHLLGNMSVLNAKFVQQAFVSRGGFDAEFGGRVAGLIELTGKSGKNNQPYFDVSANLLNSNLLANLPITKKLSVTAAWRRSYINQWHNYLYMRFIDDAPSENSGSNTVTSSIFPNMKYQDVNAKISFHPSEKLEFNMNLLYGSDNQSRDYE
ncbi:MAG TPA: TonB-dependent receptor, partial [Draconibacterium sp.]|nr:TonB-dependent receptor [Draconibacterium sp.]